MRDVAVEAGVAEPTVYAAYGNKAGLARALIDAVEASAEVAQSAAELHRVHDDPAAQLAALVASDRRLFEHGGDVIALMRDAGPAVPELHTAYREGRARGDRLRQSVFSRWPTAAWRECVDVESAVDSYAALCNIDVYRVLTHERGWPADRVERWWYGSLVRLLLA